jgi:hypothetical protein
MVMLVQESIILKTTIRRKRNFGYKVVQLFANGLWLGVCYFASGISSARSKS